MDHYIKPDFKKCAVITIDVQNDFSLQSHKGFFLVS
jgi:hypothetical protein